MKRLTVHSDGLVPLLGRQLQLGRVELSPLATVVEVIPPSSLPAVAGVVESHRFRRGDQLNLQTQSPRAINHGFIQTRNGVLLKDADSLIRCDFQNQQCCRYIVQRKREKFSPTRFDNCQLYLVLF